MTMAVIAPHKEKYFPMYWQIVYAAARQSEALKAKVGALIVTPTGMLSIGWNGMPPGFPNDCELFLEPLATSPGEVQAMKTKPEVIHAERNAIDKMTRQGVAIEGSLLFCTLAPCMECAKSIHGLGFKHIYYKEEYSKPHGLEFLTRAGVPVSKAN